MKRRDLNPAGSPLGRSEKQDRGRSSTPRKPKCTCARSSVSASVAGNSRLPLVFASCETAGVVDPPVVVTVGPKHPLSFGGVYEQPRAARWSPTGPAFARREVSRPISAEIVPLISSGPIFIAEARKFFEKVDLDAELKYFADGALAMPALVAGELDLTATTLNAGLFDTVSKGAPFKLISIGAARGLVTAR